MKQKVIIFDFDNTLVDSLSYWYKSLNKNMFIKYEKKIDKTFPKKRKGLSNMEIAQVFVDITGVNRTAEQINQEVNEQMEVYYKTKIGLISGVKEFLSTLKNEKKKLVLVTATDLPLVKTALKHFELYDFFDEIFTETSIGKHKRNKDFYEYVLSKIKCKASDVFLFEDSVVSLKSAIENGITCCGMIHKYNKHNINKLGIPLIKNYKNIKNKLKKMANNM
jgi:HAD superfamily hydrolase (TIGR01509 family)